MKLEFKHFCVASDSFQLWISEASQDFDLPKCFYLERIAIDQLLLAKKKEK